MAWLRRFIEWDMGSPPGICPIHNEQMHVESYGFYGLWDVCNGCQAEFGRQLTRSEIEDYGA